MADGSQARTIQSDGAAADAAREARGDAPVKPAHVAKAKEAAAEAKAAKGLPAHASRQVKAGKAFHEFDVDVWITRFHSVVVSWPIIFTMPITIVSSFGSVATSSGHKYWFQP